MKYYNLNKKIYLNKNESREIKIKKQKKFEI